MTPLERWGNMMGCHTTQLARAQWVDGREKRKEKKRKEKKRKEKKRKEKKRKEKKRKEKKRRQRLSASV